MKSQDLALLVSSQLLTILPLFQISCFTRLHSFERIVLTLDSQPLLRLFQIPLGTSISTHCIQQNESLSYMSMHILNISRWFSDRNVQLNSFLEIAQVISIGQPHLLKPHFILLISLTLFRNNTTTSIIPFTLQQELRWTPRSRQSTRQIQARLTPPNPQHHKRRNISIQTSQCHCQSFPCQFGSGIPFGVSANGECFGIEWDGADAWFSGRCQGGWTVGCVVFVASHDVVGGGEDYSTDFMHHSQLHNVERVIHTLRALPPRSIRIRIHSRKVHHRVHPRQHFLQHFCRRRCILKIARNDSGRRMGRRLVDEGGMF
mmetsp:Transcript_2147/g.4788  ORF Transcript_2147/g.4788 Transcript_2147/m.4788 type:complete len:317 (+) Transcript_2147:607-1557(+)